MEPITTTVPLGLFTLHWKDLTNIHTLPQKAFTPMYAKSGKSIVHCLINN